MSSDESGPWETILVPKLDEVVRTLQTGLILDKLRAKYLVSCEEYQELRSLNDYEGARSLLNSILPKKGERSFETFCNILLNTSGQDHIVKEILGLPAVETSPVIACESPQKKQRSTSSTEVPKYCTEFPEQEAEPQSLLQASISQTGLQPTLPVPQSGLTAQPSEITPKESRSSSTAAVPKSAGMQSTAQSTTQEESSKRATFYFKARHRKIVERRSGKLYALCEGSFNIQKESVKIFYEDDDDLDFQQHVIEDSYVFGGEEEKPVSVVLHGVSVAEVEENHPEVLDSIAAWLRVPRSQIELLEVKSGSAVMILRMKFEAYFELLCSLSDPDMQQQLNDILLQNMSSIIGVHVEIGGLPKVRIGKAPFVPESKLVLADWSETAFSEVRLREEDHLGTAYTEPFQNIQSLTQDSWAQLVLPKIKEISSRLKPDLVMDQLRAKGVLSRDEYGDLLLISPAEGRSREMVGNILPPKGLTALQSLCHVLLQSKDQAYIVGDVILSTTKGQFASESQNVKLAGLKSVSSDTSIPFEVDSSQRQPSSERSKTQEREGLVEVDKMEAAHLGDQVEAGRDAKVNSDAIPREIYEDKLYKDLVSQMNLIEQNPFELVWKTNQERHRKSYDALVAFVDAILDKMDWREADIPAILDSLFASKDLSIAKTTLAQVKQHGDERLKELRLREEVEGQQCTEQISEDEPLVSSLNIYHCVLLSQAAYLNSQDEVVSFLNKQPYQKLDNVALSKNASIPRYLIATYGNVVYAAFKGSDHLDLQITDNIETRRESRQRGHVPRRNPVHLRYLDHLGYGHGEVLADFFSSISHLPMRYFARQLISRKKVLFTGHSLGGTTATLATAKLLKEHFQATEENVACVTFGQLSSIAVNLPPLKNIVEMPECFHSFVSSRDTVPRSVDVWTVLEKHLPGSFMMFRNTLQSRVLYNDYNWRTVLGSAYVSIFDAVESLAMDSPDRIHMEKLEDYLNRLESAMRSASADLRSLAWSASNAMMEHQMGVVHVLDPVLHQHKEMSVWKNEAEANEELRITHIFQEVLFLTPEAVKQHSVVSYKNLVVDILGNMLSSTSGVHSTTEFHSVVPHIACTGFQMRGTDQVVVTVEGDNLWFVTEVQVEGVRPPLNVEPSDADRRSVSVVLNAADVEEESEVEDDPRKVTVHSHFSESIQFTTSVNAKRLDLTLRQKQLAKYSPSEIMEMAFLQVLLEQRIGRGGVQRGGYSKRFEFVSSFVKKAVKIVPVESVFHGIETADDEILFHCVDAARQLLSRENPRVEMSEMLMTGLKKAMPRLGQYPHLLYQQERLRKQYGNNIPESFTEWAVSSRSQYSQEYYGRHGDVDYLSFGPSLLPVGDLDYRNPDLRAIRKAYLHGVGPYSPGLKRSPQELSMLKVDITGLWRQCFNTFSLAMEEVHVCSELPLDSEGKEKIKQIKEFLTVVEKRIVQLGASFGFRPPMVMALCGVDVKEVYPAEKRAVRAKSNFEPPVDMLDRYRRELNKLAQEQTTSLELEEYRTTTSPDLRVSPKRERMSSQYGTREAEKCAMSEDNSKSEYTNQKMLKLVTSMRAQFKATSILLGAFMEATIRIPFTKSKLEHAEDRFAAATNRLGIGVWALFSLPEPELRQLLSLPQMDPMLVNVTQFLGEWCDARSESRDYAGKLQFIVNSLRDGVNASSQHVHYWLERQLVNQCAKLKIEDETSLEKLLNNWDKYFKDDVLSLVTTTYRPLVARWFKWSLMVHNLREKLASYVAVGVIGLVNSGKSRLVEQLFGIKVSLKL
jgi:hypothetical protein